MAHVLITISEDLSINLSMEMSNEQFINSIANLMENSCEFEELIKASVKVFDRHSIKKQLPIPGSSQCPERKTEI